MMKTILLTSAGMNVSGEILKILPKPPSQIKLAHVIDAAKPLKKKNYMFKDKRKMEEVGFQVEDILIGDKNDTDLRNILEDKDIIYVQGGNPFYLLQQVRKSRFGRVVKELIGRGVIYIGASAGTYLVCPTIEMAFWKGEKRSTYGITDFRGLGLVPFLVTVHYEPKYETLVKEGMRQAKYPVKILTDDQAILVTDKETKLVGKGPEVIIN